LSGPASALQFFTGNARSQIRYSAGWAAVIGKLDQLLPTRCSVLTGTPVSFGNDCYVDGFLQFHTFENLTLTVKEKLRSRDGCAVNTRGRPYGGPVIERNSDLLPLSMILKEMNVSTGPSHDGSPAETVTDSRRPLF
jgi:hypothetical protein